MPPELVWHCKFKAYLSPKFHRRCQAQELPKSLMPKWIDNGKAFPDTHSEFRPDSHRKCNIQYIAYTKIKVLLNIQKLQNMNKNCIFSFVRTFSKKITKTKTKVFGHFGSILCYKLIFWIWYSDSVYFSVYGNRI